MYGTVPQEIAAGYSQAAVDRKELHGNFIKFNLNNEFSSSSIFYDTAGISWHKDGRKMKLIC